MWHCKFDVNVKKVMFLVFLSVYGMKHETQVPNDLTAGLGLWFPGPPLCQPLLWLARVLPE